MPYVLSAPALSRELRQNIRLYGYAGGVALRCRFLCSFLEADPVAVLSKARMWHPSRRRSRIIASEDLGHWVRSVSAMPAVKDRALLLLLLFTGRRVGEAVGLRWADVDLAKKTLTARDTKNHRDHELPIAEALLPHLRALRGETGATPSLFTEDGAKPWSAPRYANARPPPRGPPRPRPFSSALSRGPRGTCRRLPQPPGDATLAPSSIARAVQLPIPVNNL